MAPAILSSDVPAQVQVRRRGAMGSIHWEVNGTEEVVDESDAETVWGTCSDVHDSRIDGNA